ncbi:hypothetical protein COY48_00390 [Candidatus Collierbacteria bacterium CG_4_10_14_0_8_um_filter_43_86]|uniref:Glycosyltransferase RgtA/B/C/D-like domain-containing protein n=2 Tax=Candidatus Collieribacteriota TaxID=1752725 RepID=A0A2H0DTY3_9BACT|nr:MAG: hypothetical protein COW83_03750 [Candidatus Collierbacteria bacterium CG22_combo_CG10-13_8_21_14_all_43_12]PIZ24927.1 MAG: hypothetical protein COY48_00390 [Candidatus Collierbacteria bacterium CG_4_10_14_0_8_um_filter_43_86]PJB48124.1 MAG: hypothetical protein CO104_01895 [Candidatus Collierbacteria bacterium CG_4_9_14_3_um_filter_43_16]
MKLTKSLWVALIVAVILRLVIMGLTFHPDLSGQVLSSYFLGYKNVFNIYDYLVNLPQTHPLVQNFGVGDIFIYPPLTYFTLGSFFKLFSWIIPEKFFLDLMSGVSVYALPNLSFNLILLKLPYLLIDIGMAFALASLFDEERQKKWAFLLWLFNPVTFYATFSMGVFDIIPALFTVLSLYFAKKKNLYLAAVMISLGAAYKQYPIFLLPFIIFAGKDFWDRLKITFCGLAPYLLTIAPFLSSSAFKYMVFGAKSQKMFYMEWMLTAAEGVYPYLLGVVLIYLHAFRASHPIQKLWKYYLGYFLLLFAVTHYHPQWFLWVSPFIIIELVANRWRNLWLDLTLLACYVFIVLTFDNSLSVGLFAVANQSLNNFPGIDKLLMAKTDLVFLKSSVRSLFAGVSLFLIFDLLQTRRRGHLK